MAVATLVLNVPQKVTLEASTSALRKVNVPAGTRYLEYDSASAWFYEVDTGQNDGGAATVASQQRISAGTASLRMPGSGGGRSLLRESRALHLVGSSASQEVWLTATDRSP